MSCSNVPHGRAKEVGRPARPARPEVKTKAFYSPEIDVLRFFAALAVVFHHSPKFETKAIADLQYFGGLGVDLFLCISAYLIVTLLRLEREATGRVDVKAFFIRRVLRIWPLYLGFASAMCLYALVTDARPTYEVLSWWASHLTFSNNLLTARRGYSEVPFTQHLWTISLEEQAYMAMPFLMVIAAKRRSVLLFCAAAIAVLVASRIALFHVRHPVIWVLPLRSDAFIIGGAFALLLARPARATGYLLAGLACLALTPFLGSLEEATPYRIIGYLTTALGFTFIIVSSQAKSGAWSWLVNPVTRYLGKVSFGIYVFHTLALAGAKQLVAAPAAVFVLGAAGAIAMAWLSYEIYEKPFLTLKARFALVASRPV